MSCLTPVLLYLCPAIHPSVNNALLSNLLRHHWLDFFFKSTCLGWSSCASPNLGPGHQLIVRFIVLEVMTPPLLNTATILFSHLLRDQWSNFYETCLGSFPNGLVVSPKFGSGPSTNMNCQIWIFAGIIIIKMSSKCHLLKLPR